MSLIQRPERNLEYYLVSFDKDGAERDDGPGGPASRLIEAALQGENYTDVFLMAHGWKGDVPGAIDQFDRWFGAMTTHPGQLRAAQTRPGFRPLRVGLHWPSLPWGDENLGTPFATETAPAVPEEIVSEFCLMLGQSADVRAAVSRVVEEARINAASDRLNPEAREAVRDLVRLLDLQDAGTPGDEAQVEAFLAQPEAFLDDGASFGGLSPHRGPLKLLVLLSFWSMKKRGRIVGESGVHSLLHRLLEITPTAVRFHLMGHSLGAVVASSALGGPSGTGLLPRPIHSLALLQGAVSLWAYAPRIERAGGRPGYFHRVLSRETVSGPVVVSTSRNDMVIKWAYKASMSITREVSFEPQEFPTIGGLGQFGIQGLMANGGHNVFPCQDLGMLASTDLYAFQAGTVFNLEGSRFISGHNVIDGPEVANVLWAAALA